MENEWLLPQMRQSDAVLTRMRACAPLLAGYGMTLREDELQALARQRLSALEANGRLEFGGGALPKLLCAFCGSPYLMRDGFADTVGTLLELFYAYKNETEQFLSDDELIEQMKEIFNGEAHGALDILDDALSELCRNKRKGDG